MSIVDAPIKAMTQDPIQTSLEIDVELITLPVKQRMDRVTKLPDGFQNKLTARLNEVECQCDYAQTISILQKDYGISAFNCYAYLTHLENHNGFCDCEVLLNYPFDNQDN